MTSFELLESFVVVKDKYVLEAHIEAVSDNNMVPVDFDKKADNNLHIRHHVARKKRVLLAAIVAAVLILVGCAYAIMNLQELSIGEYSYIKPNSQNPTEEDIVISEFISLQGLQESPEYLASKEWQDFLHDYDTDNAILNEIGNNPTGLEELSLYYQVYTKEMYDKLNDIAEKYDLGLHSEMNMINEEELDYRVGGTFMGEGLSRGWAYLYENGTFQFDGEALIDGKVVDLQLRRTVKGTLDEVVLNIGSTDEYQEVQYETNCGETVFLEWGTDHSLIYADFEECFVLINILAGREGGLLTEAAITIDDLKRMADAIDFNILKNVVKPDMRGDSIVENGQNLTDESIKQEDGTETENGQVTESDSEVSYGNIEKDRLLAYQTVLMDICRNQEFRGGRELGYDGSPMSDNQFALYDIDKDGNIELLLVYRTTSTSGQSMIIYDYDSESDSVREQFVEYPAVTFFDNGILKADWSHNQGLGGRIWPYTLYQYNSENDSYEAIAMVDAWDKNLTDKDYAGNIFPDDIDKDGDGLVYYIMDADKYELTDPVDLNEYEEWFEGYCKDADTIKISFRALTEENISQIK